MNLEMGCWLLAQFMATAALAFTGVGLATSWARRQGVLALPGERQSHQVATPTGGGIGMVAAVLLAALLPGPGAGLPPAWTAGVLPGLAILSLVGWLDDRYTVHAALRLVVQVAVSLWLLACLRNGWSAGGQASWSAAPALLGLVGLMNAWNFMDGSNGMAGGQGLFTGLVLAGLFALAGQPGLALAALGVAAACAGFLPWNIPRARVFMGDAGSVPLGFALGGLLLLGWQSGALSLAVAVLLPALFWVDAGLTLGRRFLRGEQWYTAHRQHVYQRLILDGRSHKQVLALYQAINLFVVLPGVVLGTVYPGSAWPVTGILILVMITAWQFASLKAGEKT